MGDFPSGQRGQTVNLLSLTSVVRIHHPPPTKKDQALRLVFFVASERAGEVCRGRMPHPHHGESPSKRLPPKRNCLLLSHTFFSEKPQGFSCGRESTIPPPNKNELLPTKTKVRFLNDVCLRQMMTASPNDVRYANDVCLTAQ